MYLATRGQHSCFNPLWHCNELCQTSTTWMVVVIHRTAQVLIHCCCVYVLQKERRLLENLRLDLDACKTRLKKAKVAEAKAAVSRSLPHTHTHSHNHSYMYVIKLWVHQVLTMTNCTITTFAVRGWSEY